MGGLLVVDNPAWMVKRLTLETVRQNPLVASSTLAGLSLLAPVSTTTSSLVAAAAAQLQQQQQQQQQSGGTLGFPIDVATLSGNGIGAVGAVASQIPANIGVGSNIPPAGSNGTGHFSDLTDRQLYDRIVQERQTNFTGRRADPRMNRALVLSLEDPNLPALMLWLREDSSSGRPMQSWKWSAPRPSRTARMFHCAKGGTNSRDVFVKLGNGSNKRETVVR